MHISRLWLENFRNYQSLQVEFPKSGLVVLHGMNAQGKTNLLEAVGYCAIFRSFRNSSTEVLIRNGEDSAIVRAQAHRSGRDLLLESQLSRTARTRSLLNKQPVSRAKQSQDGLLVTVFCPDDLELVKGGPSVRRQYVDDLLMGTNVRNAALVSDVERIIKQRNALLKQASISRQNEILSSLEVWDQRLVEAGEQLGKARENMLNDLLGLVNKAYQRLVPSSNQNVEMHLLTNWRQVDGAAGLKTELQKSRDLDLRRGITSVGPHRDDVVCSINAMASREKCSQGEQRSLALSMRLAGHELLTQLHEAPPILLLDDVFSELDVERSLALINELPSSQTFVTTAGDLPAEASPDLLVEISEGKVCF